MQRDILRLDWEHFDRAVTILADALADTEAKKIYGVPRGGLILAVALSHRLGLPLSDTVDHETLWVDDIVDSGATLRLVLGHCCDYCCWVTRLQPVPVLLQAPIQLNCESWVLFPWEDPQKVLADAEAYLNKPQGRLF